MSRISGFGKRISTEKGGEDDMSAFLASLERRDSGFDMFTRATSPKPSAAFGTRSSSSLGLAPVSLSRSRTASLDKPLGYVLSESKSEPVPMDEGGDEYSESEREREPEQSDAFDDPDDEQVDFEQSNEKDAQPQPPPSPLPPPPSPSKDTGPAASMNESSDGEERGSESDGSNASDGYNSLPGIKFPDKYSPDMSLELGLNPFAKTTPTGYPVMTTFHRPECMTVCDKIKKDYMHTLGGAIRQAFPAWPANGRYLSAFYDVGKPVPGSSDAVLYKDPSWHFFGFNRGLELGKIVPGDEDKKMCWTFTKHCLDLMSRAEGACAGTKYSDNVEKWAEQWRGTFDDTCYKFPDVSDVDSRLASYYVWRCHVSAYWNARKHLVDWATSKFGDVETAENVVLLGIVPSSTVFVMANELDKILRDVPEDSRDLEDAYDLRMSLQDLLKFTLVDFKSPSTYFSLVGTRDLESEAKSIKAWRSRPYDEVYFHLVFKQAYAVTVGPRGEDGLSRIQRHDRVIDFEERYEEHRRNQMESAKHHRKQETKVRSEWTINYRGSGDSDSDAEPPAGDEERDEFGGEEKEQEVAKGTPTTRDEKSKQKASAKDPRLEQKRRGDDGGGSGKDAKTTDSDRGDSKRGASESSRKRSRSEDESGGGKQPPIKKRKTGTSQFESVAAETSTPRPKIRYNALHALGDDSDDADDVDEDDDVDDYRERDRDADESQSSEDEDARRTMTAREKRYKKEKERLRKKLRSLEGKLSRTVEDKNAQKRNLQTEAEVSKFKNTVQLNIEKREKKEMQQRVRQKERSWEKQRLQLERQIREKQKEVDRSIKEAKKTKESAATRELKLKMQMMVSKGRGGGAAAAATAGYGFGGSGLFVDLKSSTKDLADWLREQPVKDGDGKLLDQVLDRIQIVGDAPFQLHQTLAMCHAVFERHESHLQIAAARQDTTPARVAALKRARYGFVLVCEASSFAVGVQTLAKKYEAEASKHAGFVQGAIIVRFSNSEVWGLAWFPKLAPAAIEAVTFWMPIEPGGKAIVASLQPQITSLQATGILANSTSVTMLVPYVLFDARSKRAPIVKQRLKYAAISTAPACAWMVGYLLATGLRGPEAVSGKLKDSFAFHDLDSEDVTIMLSGAKKSAATWQQSMHNWLVMAKMLLIIW